MRLMLAPRRAPRAGWRSPRLWRSPPVLSTIGGIPEGITPQSGGSEITGVVSLYLDGFEEAIGKANLRQGRRGVE